MNSKYLIWSAGLLLTTLGTPGKAQVSAYTFSSSIGTWTPINGSGTPLGLAGLPDWLAIDDNAFVQQGVDIPLGPLTTGNGWPIGFDFHYNGHVFDRVGFSTEGWLSFGRSQDGAHAVYVPIGAAAYTPISTESDPLAGGMRRHRIVGFANDLKAGGGVSNWPIQIRTFGTAPDRTFVAEYNLTRTGNAGGSFSFQIRLSEGGGDPAAQIIQVIYGTMSVSGTYSGEVGLSGLDASDHNNRSVTVSPYDWQVSTAGTDNAATCRIPSSAAQLPQGLTFTWTPPACAVHDITISDLIGVGLGASATLSWAAVTGASSYDYIITAGSATDPVLLSGSGITGTSVDLEDLPGDQALHAYVRADCATAWGGGLPFTTVGIVELVCGQPPLQGAYCYGDMEHRTWTYSSSTGDPVRLIFNAGAVPSGDVLLCYDGTDTQAPLIFSSNGNAVLDQVVSAPSGHLTMRIMADYLGSCASGNVDALEWVVGCLDCDPVLATFSVVDDCPNAQFSVNVQVFSMGTATALTIENDGGAPTVEAGATGLYVTGPYPIGQPVIVSALNGVNDFCSSVSAPMESECPTGLSEYGASPLRVYPNPGSGRFVLEMPTNTVATTITVMDMTGRTVRVSSDMAVQDGRMVLDLSDLPDGGYWLAVQVDGQRLMSKLQVVH
ncbi:MAG TPA: T9SS type A sorting domain-containing protein [Flavobacteriales bacterium]